MRERGERGIAQPRDPALTPSSAPSPCPPPQANKREGASSRRRLSLRGIMVGNPSTDRVTDRLGAGQFLWNHGLISDETRQDIADSCKYGEEGRGRQGAGPPSPSSPSPPPSRIPSFPPAHVLSCGLRLSFLFQPAPPLVAVAAPGPYGEPPMADASHACDEAFERCGAARWARRVAPLPSPPAPLPHILRPCPPPIQVSAGDGPDQHLRHLCRCLRAPPGPVRGGGV